MTFCDLQYYWQCNALLLMLNLRDFEVQPMKVRQNFDFEWVIMQVIWKNWF